MKIETPILRRLGPVPFWRGEQKCLDELERIYRRAAAHAEAVLHPPHSATKGENVRMRQHKSTSSLG